MRKLATIQKIKEIQPIKNADRLELAIVNDWNVVVLKDKYKKGDLVVYCEIDSFLPIREEFEFLRNSSFKKDSLGNEGFRLRTIKLRGQISQGLILPLDLIPLAFLYELIDQTVTNHSYLIGTEVTDELGIIKYEPPIPAQLSGVIRGYFPSFITKTNEERIQNLTDEYEEFKNSIEEFYVTEKLDGSSSTFYLKNGDFGVCSRNLDIIEDEDNSIWKIARKLNLEEKLSIFDHDVALQGELIGEGIQGNPYSIKGQGIKFFNIFNIEKRQKYSFTEFLNNMDHLQLDTVPYLDNHFVLPDTIKELLKVAEGSSKLNNKITREGLVIRNKLNTLSFKVISNKFLLQ